MLNVCYRLIKFAKHLADGNFALFQDAVYTTMKPREREHRC